jgi:hypothetical protein
MRSEEDMTPDRYGLPKVRRAALDRLARAYAEDDLELEDYEDRTEALEAAGSLQDVARVMADIPDFDPETFTGGGAQFLPPRPAFTGRESHVGPAGGPGRQGDAAPATAIQIIGDRKVSLADFRNGEIRIFTLLGDTKVDLSDLRSGETAYVRDFGLLGDFTLRVPTGTQVIRRRIVLLGDEKRVSPAMPAAASPPPVPPRVVIEGFRLLGDTKIVDL